MLNNNQAQNYYKHFNLMIAIYFYKYLYKISKILFTNKFQNVKCVLFNIIILIPMIKMKIR